LKPRVQISIGTLDDWHQQRYDHRSKRRRLNKTLDDIGEESESDQDMVELAKSEGALDKSFLHENWIEDFEKERIKAIKNSKKRKRPSSRSKSRSPTPVSSENLQYERVAQRKASLKHKSDESNNNNTQPKVSDSEEEDRLELLKI